jgi:hypothetical protein
VTYNYFAMIDVWQDIDNYFEGIEIGLKINFMDIYKGNIK